MTDSRTKEICSVLEKSEMAVKKVVEGASEELFLHKPAKTSWSMAELVEHIIIVEKGILGTIQKMGAKNPTEAIADKFTDAKLIAITAKRGRKVAAPKHFEPKGIFTTKAMAMEALSAHRVALKEFITTTTLPLDKIGFPHFLIGMLSAEKWFTFMAGHCLRHVEQMAEINI